MFLFKSKNMDDTLYVFPHCDDKSMLKSVGRELVSCQLLAVSSWSAAQSYLSHTHTRKHTIFAAPPSVPLLSIVVSSRLLSHNVIVFSHLVFPIISLQHVSLEAVIVIFSVSAGSENLFSALLVLLQFSRSHHTSHSFSCLMFLC